MGSVTYVDRPATRRLAVAGLAVMGCVLSMAPAATAAVKNCPARHGTLAKTPLGNVWHHGRSLYGCSTVHLQRPRAVRLGRWARSTRVAFDGVSVAWTSRATRGGALSDRMRAASLEGSPSRWLRGVRLVPAAGPAPSRDGLIQRILLTGGAVAWVTQSGDVALALEAPEGDPIAIGSLPSALIAPRTGPLLVGSWPDAALGPLSRSATLTAGQGEGDECGGTIPYTLTVVPSPGLPAIGATWSGGYVSASC